MESGDWHGTRTGTTWRVFVSIGLKGVSEGIISHENYNRMLFIALGTLTLTPLLLKFGLRWTDSEDVAVGEKSRKMVIRNDKRRAVVIGIGPIGRQLANRLNNLGVEFGFDRFESY